MAPNNARTISCIAWKSPLEYKHDIKDSQDNMFYPIFKGNIQGQKHPGRCVVKEPELPCFGKPKYLVQNEQNWHKVPMIVATIMMKYHSIKVQVKRTHSTPKQQRTTQNSPIYCDGLQLTKACHMIPVSISVYIYIYI